MVTWWKRWLIAEKAIESYPRPRSPPLATRWGKTLRNRHNSMHLEVVVKRFKTVIISLTNWDTHKKVPMKLPYSLIHQSSWWKLLRYSYHLVSISTWLNHMKSTSFVKNHHDFPATPSPRPSGQRAVGDLVRRPAVLHLCENLRRLLPLPRSSWQINGLFHRTASFLQWWLNGVFFLFL